VIQNVSITGLNLDNVSRASPSQTSLRLVGGHLWTGLMAVPGMAACKAYLDNLNQSQNYNFVTVGQCGAAGLNDDGKW
jgi:hypothetical protein